MNFEEKIYLLKHAGLEDELAQLIPAYEADAAHPGRSFLGGAATGLGALGGYHAASRFAPSAYRGMAGIAGALLGGGGVGILGEYMGRDDRAQENMIRDLQDVHSDIQTGFGIADMDPYQRQELMNREQEIAQYLASRGK